MIESSNEYIKVDIEKYFFLGQKFLIKRLFVEDDKEFYPTYLKDLTKKSFFIDLPTKYGVNIPLYENKEIELTCISNEGIWLSKSIINNIQLSGITGAWISYPKLLEKVQRREYKRWELNFSVKIFVFPSDQNLETPEEIIKTDIKNISGGGVAVLTKQQLPLNKTLYLNLDFEGVFAFCKLKLIHEQYDLITKKLITGYQYIDLDQNVADKIHKIGIQDQLEMRRKGLI